MSTVRAVQVRYLLTAEGQTLEHATLSWDAAGRIAYVGPTAAAPRSNAKTTDLGDVLLVAGRINAHSHAFQRLLRGRVERMNPQHPNDDFWSWRDTMYTAAATLDPEGIYIVSRMAFLEMALAGITCVGEFHYLHHQPDGALYADPNLLAHRVIDAARDVGLRINLLRVAYARAGADKPPQAHQLRFVDKDPYTMLARVEALAARWRDDPLVQIGLAPHSMRAVDREWLSTIVRERSDRVVHIHACEQQAEIAEVIDEYGAPPITALADLGLLGPRTTIVHATHLDGAAPAHLAATGSTVCACPSTERNLGDGFLPVTALLRHSVPICLGSDSQADIDPWAEARLIEYHERLRQRRRCVVAQVGDSSVARQLDVMGTTAGARSLGFETGALVPGLLADFVALDINDPTLAGFSIRDGLEQMIFSARPRSVRAVFVGGTPVVRAGRHPAQAEIIKDYSRLCQSMNSWSRS